MRNKIYILLIVIALILINVGCKDKKENLALEYNRKALELNRTGNSEKAIDLLSKAIILNNHDATIYCNRGIIFLETEKYEQAINDLTKAIELYKNSDDFLIKVYEKMFEHRFYAYWYLQDYEKALIDINVLINIDSLNADYYKKRGDIFSDIDSLSLSIKDYDSAIRINPNLTYAYVNRSLEFYDIKEYKKALNDADIVLRNKDKIESYTYNTFLLLKGFILFEFGEYANAKGNAELFIRYNPQDATGFVLLALIYYKMGDMIISNQIYKTAISLKTEIDNGWGEYHGFIRGSEEVKKALNELERI